MAAFSLGLRPTSLSAAPNQLQKLIECAQHNEFSFINVPIQVNASDQQPLELRNIEDLRRWQNSLMASSDRSLLNSSDWDSRILFSVSLKDANLHNLLEYAAHMSVFAVLVENDWSFVEEVEEKLKSYLNARGSVFPFKFYFKCEANDWNKWRALSEKFPDFSVVLDLNSASQTKPSFEIWKAEPLKGVCLNASKTFLRNSSGYPVLPKWLQVFLCSLYNWIERVPLILEASIDVGLNDFAVYLKWLLDPERCLSLLPEESRQILNFAKGFENVLQTPLQPLHDHLASETYEVFERDPVKYRLYGAAIEKALVDLSSLRRPVKVGVFGAGRGPLVQEVLHAAERASVTVSVLVVEKNPNACLTLLDLFSSDGRIEILFSDMRQAAITPGSLDLIVSELLGSFGDNELSPECLWPCEVYLNESHGIFIPQEYTSFLEPVYAPQLHAQVFDLQQGNLLAGDAFDYSYVVFPTKTFKPSTACSCFAFKHQIANTVADASERRSHLIFNICGDLDTVVIDGLLGYFDCKLYGDVRMSTVPFDASPGMLSWFPVYFPLKEAVKLDGPHQKQFKVTMRRCRDGDRIWYEWGVLSDADELLLIHNEEGKSFSLHLK